MIESGLYKFLTQTSAITALLGSQASVYFSVLPKQPTVPAVRFFRATSKNADETLDLPTSDAQTITARFQFDTFGGDNNSPNPAVNKSGYLAAAALSEAIRGQLLAQATEYLPDGTLLQDVRILDEFDSDYEEGGTGYLYKRVLDVLLVFVSTGSAPPAPAFYEGDGPPTTLHNNGDLYYDLSTGNLYEQVAGDWTLVSTISGGGGSLTRYSNLAGTLTVTGDPTVWTLSVPFTASAMVFRNGELLSPIADYSTSGSQITFVIAPSSGDNLVVME